MKIKYLVPLAFAIGSIGAQAIEPPPRATPNTPLKTMNPVKETLVPKIPTLIDIPDRLDNSFSRQPKATDNTPPPYAFNPPILPARPFNLYDGDIKFLGFRCQKMFGWLAIHVVTKGSVTTHTQGCWMLDMSEYSVMVRWSYGSADFFPLEKEMYHNLRIRARLPNTVD